MNKNFQILIILAALALFATACGAQIVQAQPAELAEPNAVAYETVLGKSLNDQEVADFIASNCTPAGSMQYCQPAGLALWIDANQTVRQVYLYINNAEGFAAYKGELPFGLASNNTMADVKQQLGQWKVDHAPQAGWEPGMPDEGVSRDLTYYWAVYRRFGLTVIYNTPAATDQDATIHAIILSK